MKGLSTSSVTFGATALGTLGIAAVARAVCPAGCGTCESCVSGLAPLAAPLLAIGGVSARRAWRDRSDAGSTDGGQDAGDAG